MLIKAKSRSGVAILSLCLALVFFESVALASGTHNGQIAKNVAVRIIVSEAADQGLKGMICVGEVIRHTNNVKGFYGYKFNRMLDQPKAIWEMAAKAWELSEHTNYTRGANHFENVRRFGEPWWAKYCVKTYEYKDHVFYKEIRQQ